MSAAVKVFPSRAASRPPLEKSQWPVTTPSLPDILNRCRFLYTAEEIFPGATRRRRSALSSSTKPCRELTGPAKTRLENASSSGRPTLYLPVSQADDSNYVLRDWVVRASGDPLTIASSIRAAMREVDPDLPVSRLRSLEQVRNISVAPQRFNLSLFGLFAALALVLAAVGIYGVMAYSVAQRTREIGIRMALGAQRRDVVKLVLGQGLRHAALGVFLGLAGAFALTRLMASLLYGVRPTDPITFAGVTLILAGVALLACYLPARKAMRVDPMVALRYE